MASNNLKNTERTQFRTGSEQVKTARKGGVASGKSRRKKKEIKDHLEILLNSKHKDKSGKEMTGAEMMALKAFQEALKGNPKWWELVRDTVGQKPVEKVEVSNIDTGIMDEIEKMMNDE